VLDVGSYELRGIAYLVSTYSIPSVSHHLPKLAFRAAHLARTCLRGVDVRAVEACSDEEMKRDVSK
jgi:hypothetical protein